LKLLPIKLYILKEKEEGFAPLFNKGGLLRRIWAAAAASAGGSAGRLSLGNEDDMVVEELLQQEIVEIGDLYGFKKLQT
jgi:hypothetical protein